MTTATPSAELVDMDGLAVMLACSKRHAARLDVAGKLPMGLKLGRCKRWVVQEIRDWVTAGCPPRSKWEVIKSGGPKLRVAR